jgi:monoamine oxidase
VIILEAADRLGGRIFSNQPDGFSTPIEGGAEFIHGDLPLTFKLLKKAGIEAQKFEGNIHRKIDGKLEKMEESFEGWGELLKKMKKQKKDMPFAHFLDKNYGSEEYRELRNNAQAFAEGFSLADINVAGIKGLYTEWSNQQGVTYRIPQGYTALINFLADEATANGAEIRKNFTVNKIQWSKGEVIVESADGRNVVGQKVLITVSAGILQQTQSSNTIKFRPSAEEHINNYRRIGFGFVLKVVFQFRYPFWNEYVQKASYILSDEVIPTWWPGQSQEAAILTGWKGGPTVLALREMDDDSIVEFAVESLANIFELSIEEIRKEIVAVKVFNWQRNEWVEGGYSYSSIESDEARAILNEPIDDTIYFAGEGLYHGKFGSTVEAALISGKEAAKKIRKG